MCRGYGLGNQRTPKQKDNPQHQKFLLTPQKRKLNGSFITPQNRKLNGSFITPKNRKFLLTPQKRKLNGSFILPNNSWIKGKKSSFLMTSLFSCFTTLQTRTHTHTHTRHTQNTPLKKTREKKRHETPSKRSPQREPRALLVRVRNRKRSPHRAVWLDREPT